MGTYFYKDGQGFAIVYEEGKNFLKDSGSGRLVKIYIPGIKTYTKSYIFDNLNQGDVVMKGFFDWLSFGNYGDIYENLINDLGNQGLSKKFLVIQYKLPSRLHKIISLESLKNFIIRLNLVDTYEELFLRDNRFNTPQYKSLHKPVSKEIIFRLIHLNVNNLRTVLPPICKNFRELVRRLNKYHNYSLMVKNDFYFKMSTLLIYFKKKKLLKD